MDDLDKQLLNITQTGFPVCTRPYEVLAEQLGASEDEALSRVKALVEAGVIRRIGPSFDTRKLGHTSTLVAARVPEASLHEVADIVSSHPQVTHNYGRNHEYNLWFTLICAGEDEIERLLAEIKAQTGVEDMHPLPAERMFKIRVNFEF